MASMVTRGARHLAPRVPSCDPDRRCAAWPPSWRWPVRRWCRVATTRRRAAPGPFEAVVAASETGRWRSTGDDIIEVWVCHVHPYTQAPAVRGAAPACSHRPRHAGRHLPAAREPLLPRHLARCLRADVRRRRRDHDGHRRRRARLRRRCHRRGRRRHRCSTCRRRRRTCGRPTGRHGQRWRRDGARGRSECHPPVRLRRCGRLQPANMGRRPADGSGGARAGSHTRVGAQRVVGRR